MIPDESRRALLCLARGGCRRLRLHVIDRAISGSQFRGAPPPHDGAVDFKLDSLVAATAEVLRDSPWIPGCGVSDLRLAAAALSEKLPQTAEARDFVGMLDQMAGQGW